jgi:hypothetical protein
MAQENYDLIAAALPTDTNEASLYLVQDGEQIIATVTVCNQTAGAVTCRVGVAPESGAAAAKNWLRYNKSVAANDFITVPIAAGPGRDIRIRSASGSALSFVLMGCRRILST